MFSGTNFNEIIRQIMVKVRLFVYSNLVEYGFVGDTKSKLLQSFASLQRIKNDVLSLIPTNDLNFFTEPSAKNL